MGEKKDRRNPVRRVVRTILRVFAWVVVALVAALVALVAFLPEVASRIDYPDVEIDLSTNFTGRAAALVSNKTARAMFRVECGDDGGLAVHAGGMLLDWPFSADVNLNWRWRFIGVDIDGDADIRLDGSPWKATAEFAASSSGEWGVDVEMPAAEIDRSDPVTGLLASRLDLDGVENLDYSALVSLKARAERTKALPVPKWSASARIRNCDVSFERKGGRVGVTGFQTGAGASGVADHVDISPMFMHAACVEGLGLSLSNAFASVRATETALLVTEAGARFCGGDLRMYSFFLDPSRLNAGLTLFVDGLDAGETLRLFNGFTGEATGKLHGKLPLTLKDGSEVRLGTAYLYSVPGETGSIRVYDPEPIMQGLGMGGVSKSSRENLALALADLSYDTLSIRLSPEGRDSMALSLKVEGSSTHDGTTVPVSFDVTFHGDIEQLVNPGLKARMRKRKGDGK